MLEFYNREQIILYHTVFADSDQKTLIAEWYNLTDIHPINKDVDPKLIDVKFLKKITKFGFNRSD